jgi:hypothetical protein
MVLFLTRTGTQAPRQSRAVKVTYTFVTNLSDKPIHHFPVLSTALGESPL